MSAELSDQLESLHRRISETKDSVSDQTRQIETVVTRLSAGQHAEHEKIGESLKSLEKITADHTTALFGDRERGGVVHAVREMGKREATRARFLWALAGGVVLLIVKAIAGAAGVTF